MSTTTTIEKSPAVSSESDIRCEDLFPESKAAEGVAYLFGYPIAHSLSPTLHGTVNEGLGLRWKQFLLESKDISLFLKLLRESKCVGSAVTMPHKIAILPFLDDLTTEGREVGAVNTIFFRNENNRRLLIGTNTDVVGVSQSFYRNVTDPDVVFHRRPGLVIGGGGAARSAVYALQRLMHCSPIYLVNRDRSEVAAVISECKAKGFGDDLIDVATLEQAEALAGPGAVVGCVPDFPPTTTEEKTARRIIECFFDKTHKGAFLEMAYHPSPWTALGSIAEKSGWQVILGTEAMIYQGFAQASWWTGRSIDEMPVDRCKEVIAMKLRESRH